MLIFAWLFSSQGIAPALVLAAAKVDGDHVVKVGASEKGDFTVVLAHEGIAAAEHDVLCALIVAFAHTTSGGHADHVLSFKAVEDASRRVLEDVAPASLPLLVAVLQIERVVKIPPRRSAHPLIVRPWSPGLDVKSRGTVLLC